MPRTFRSKTLAGGVVVDGKRAAKSPERHTCLLRTLHCLPWTGPVASPRAPWRFDPQSYRRRLAELKSDLREALIEVQAHEQDIAGPVKEGAKLALQELEIGLKEMLQKIQQETSKRTHKDQRRVQPR
jgi:hypothetical protein